MVSVNKLLEILRFRTKLIALKTWKSLSSVRSKLRAFKTFLLIVVLVAEIVLPYAFYLGLKAFGDSKEKMLVLQNLMVILTSGIFLGLLVSLAKDSLGE